MKRPKSKVIPIANCNVEDKAQEVVRPDGMRPYDALLDAQMWGEDTSAFVSAIRALPLEERYVWRIMSALEWAFCDFNTNLVNIDLRTLRGEKRAELNEDLQVRTLQFLVFVCNMLGEVAGEREILQALDRAKTVLAF
jgi:hypothetical protein